MVSYQERKKKQESFSIFFTLFTCGSMLFDRYFIFFAHEYLFSSKQQQLCKNRGKNKMKAWSLFRYFFLYWLRVWMSTNRVRVHKAAKTMKKYTLVRAHTHINIFNACLLLRSLLEMLLLFLCYFSMFFPCLSRHSWERKTWRKYMLCEAIKYVLI